MVYKLKGWCEIKHLYHKITDSLLCNNSDIYSFSVEHLLVATRCCTVEMRNLYSVCNRSSRKYDIILAPDGGNPQHQTGHLLQVWLASHNAQPGCQALWPFTWSSTTCNPILVHKLYLSHLPWSSTNTKLHQTWVEREVSTYVRYYHKWNYVFGATNSRWCQIW